MKRDKSILVLEKGEITYINSTPIVAISNTPVAVSLNNQELFSNCCFAPILGQFANSHSIIKEGMCSKCHGPAIFDTMENFAYNCEQ